MSFNTNSSKLVQEILFSRKLHKVSHPKLLFSNVDVLQTNSQKHLGVVLDSKSNFHNHLDLLKPGKLLVIDVS